MPPLRPHLAPPSHLHLAPPRRILLAAPWRLHLTPMYANLAYRRLLGAPTSRLHALQTCASMRFKEDDCRVTHPGEGWASRLVGVGCLVFAKTKLLVGMLQKT